MSRARYLLSAPTGGEIDISLSFRITSRSTSMSPALLSASNAMPARHRAVADHRDRAALLAFQLAPRPPCRAPRRSTCSNARCRTCRIRFRSRRGKPEMPLPHAQLLHAFAPAGEDLVPVGLVADVPHDAVVGRVEHVMQRDRELDRAEVGREMAAGLAHRFEQELRAARCASRAKLAPLERAQLVRDSRSISSSSVHRRICSAAR